MNTELKEKIQQAAKKHCAQICNTCGSRKNCNHVDLGRCLPTEDEYSAFIDGSEAMYSELAPIVEWVSVEDKLPDSKEWVIVKFYTKWSKNSPKKDGCIGIASYDSEEKFWHTLLNDFKQESVTHWRKIEL